MSRKYNIESRMLKAYQNYVEQFTKRSTAQLARGYQIVAPKILSFEEFKGNRTLLRKMGVASGNITRVIVSKQIYEFSQEDAKAMFNALQDLGIIDKKDMTIYGTKVTLEALRSKGGIGGEALSLINDKLKEDPKYANSYDRAEYIRELVFQDSL